MNENENENEKIKEDFCPVCLSAVPLAFSMISGANEVVNDSNNSDDDKDLTPRLWYHSHRKNRKLHISILIGLIALAAIIYFKYIKQCDECK